MLRLHLILHRLRCCLAHELIRAVARNGLVEVRFTSGLLSECDLVGRMIVVIASRGAFRYADVTAVEAHLFGWVINLWIFRKNFGDILGTRDLLQLTRSHFVRTEPLI